MAAAQKKSKAPVRGRDVSRPVDRIDLGGESYPLAFDMNAFRVAEDVYELHFGRDMNFAEIWAALARGKLGAMMAVMYGALCSGGTEMDWHTFSSLFKLTDIPGVQDALMRRVQDAMPDPEDLPESPS